MEKPNYSVALGLFLLLAIVAWIAVAIGLVLGLWGLADVLDNRGYKAVMGVQRLVGGIGLFVTGILTIAGIQIGRAVIDNALISWEMLQIMRNQAKS
jgi:hypothetical protein